jgi:TetR/AcrR family transcriptional repressor of lmrAB and yxaGH operons
MRKSHYRDGCPITTVLLELAPRERAVAEAGRSAYAARVHVFSQKLLADGVPAARAARLATLCVSVLQGALIQARVERSGAPLDIAAEELAALLRTQARQATGAPRD